MMFGTPLMFDPSTSPDVTTLTMKISQYVLFFFFFFFAAYNTFYCLHHIVRVLYSTSLISETVACWNQFSTPHPVTRSYVFFCLRVLPRRKFSSPVVRVGKKLLLLDTFFFSRCRECGAFFTTDVVIIVRLHVCGKYRLKFSSLDHYEVRQIF